MQEILWAWEPHIAILLFLMIFMGGLICGIGIGAILHKLHSYEIEGRKREKK